MITKRFINNPAEVHKYLFRIDGNVCIVVSDIIFPNQYAVYDIDAGDFFHMKYEHLRQCEVTREVEETDYQYDAISNSTYTDFVQELMNNF